MSWFKKKPAVVKAVLGIPKWIRARFDAAQTTKDNAKHWAAAEFLSADAEADSSARKILRTRARYEVQNNSYARGIVSTLANDTIGTGPRLQMLLENEDQNRRVEHDFTVWSKRVHLAAKLRTMRMARCQDGEAFALLGQNTNLKSNVKLDLQLIEADGGNKVNAKTPMRKFGRPSDLHGAVRFLLSDEAGFVTGVTLPVDGGFVCYSGV